MKLKELLKTLKSCKIEGSEDVEIFDIQYDSRKVRKGSLFIAIKGKDGWQSFCGTGFREGAVAVVTDSPEFGVLGFATTIYAPNAREALAKISTAFYGQPASKLKLVGITGAQREDDNLPSSWSLF